MLLRSEDQNPFDAYIREVILSQPCYDIDALGLRALQVPDDAVVTLPDGEHPGSVFGDDIWEWPESLMPFLTPHARKINFQLPFDLRQVGGEDVLKVIKTFVILSIMVPLQRRRRLPSLRELARVLNEFSYKMITREGVYQFSELSPAVYAKLIEDIGANRQGFSRKLLTALDSIREYGRRSLIVDYPGAKGSERKSDDVIVDRPDEEVGEQTPGDEELDERVDGEDSRQFRPLSDDYVSEMGARCLFYLEQIGPNLVRLFADRHPDNDTQMQSWRPKGRRIDGPALATVRSARTLAWKDFLKDFEWLDSGGNKLTEMPFSCEKLSFPAVSQMDVLRLVGRHMDALLHMLLLLSGGRGSEVQSFRRDVIVRPSSAEDQVGFAIVEGKTLKSSASHHGDDRNWPIPEIVSSWIANQTALANVLGPANGKNIWIGMNTAHKNGFRINIYFRCTQFAVRHGLSHLVDGNAHPHRYRKTIARMALLALTGAPMLIRRMFGHRDLMTTLHYLLSDVNIRDDLRELLGERRVEIALNLMEGLDSASGQAASALRSARDAYFDEMKIPFNARSQKISLLQFVTANLIDGAVDIKVVYPGVVCIRGLEQDGACAAKGLPIDPARCQSRCNFRMDLPLRKSEVTGIIEDCLSIFLKAEEEDDLLIKAAMAANVMDNVEIYPDIHDFYRNDERYIRVLEACNG